MRLTQIIAFSLLVVVILLVVIIFIYMRNSRILRQKNLKLYNQYKETDNYIQQIKSLIGNKDNINIESGSNANGNRNGEKELYEKANEILIKEQYFTDPEISREDLALKLGTNRQYLTDAIRTESGKTFTDYINDFRLEYAAHKLTREKGASVQDIFLKSGFSSKATFYRLFREKYGMTPNELRLIAESVEESLL